MELHLLLPKMVSKGNKKAKMITTAAIIINLNGEIIMSLNRNQESWLFSRVLISHTRPNGDLISSQTLKNDLSSNEIFSKNKLK